MSTKISRAKLIEKLPIGTKLIMIESPLGICHKHRTIFKASSRELVMIAEDKDGKPKTYLSFYKGDKTYLNENGFTVECGDGSKLVYVFDTNS